MRRPPMPPAALMFFTASSTPIWPDSPTVAPLPVSGIIAPTLIGAPGDCAVAMAATSVHASIPIPTKTRMGTLLNRWIDGLCLRGLAASLQLVLRCAVLPREGHVVRLQQAIVGKTRDRREVAVRDVARALEATDVVRHGAEREVDGRAVPRRQVGRGGMHQAAMEEDHGAGGALR